MSLIKAKTIRAWWFNPKTSKVEKPFLFKPKQKQWFIPPTLGKGNDWVFCLDDIQKEYKTPGVE